MALTKPQVLPAWAEAGDKVQPSNAEIQAGWPLSNVPPSRQRFNWILNFISNAVRYLLQRGLPEWSASEDYPIGSRVQYAGSNYVSLTANTNKQPDTNTSDWEQWGYGDTAFQGRVDQLASFSVTTADVTLTAAQAKAGILNVSGTLTGNRNIIIPNSPRRFIIINGTSGAYSLGVKTASGSAVTVAQGAATSVVCDGANNVKLASPDLSSYAPINSPALTGNPTAPTPAQFNNDTSIATTEFVQRALGNMRGAAAYTTGGIVNLSAADVGKQYILSGLSGTGVLVLPQLSTVPAGAAFLIKCESSTPNWTIQTHAADGVKLIYSATSVSSAPIKLGQFALIVSDGQLWRSQGTFDLKLSDDFGSLFAGNGYQKLPSGYIEQWGAFYASATPGNPVPVTFPIAFTTACYEVHLLVRSTATGVQSFQTWFDGPSVTGFNGHCATANVTVFYRAIGY